MRPLIRDLHFAWRGLRKSPVFTTVAVLTLALGIGANTAIFALMDQLLLRYLPVRHPEQLVMLDQDAITSGLVIIPHSFSYPMYKDFRDQGQVFSSVLARYPFPVSVGYQGQTERAAGEIVSGNYFEVLGISAYAGRTLTSDDDRTPGGHPVAFLTYGYWMRQFGGDRSILNQTLLINGHPMTVVGIGPRGFDGVEVGRATDVMVPVMMQAQIAPGLGEVLGNRRTWWLNVFARLKPGVPLKQVEASCNVLFRQINTAEFNAIPGAPEHFRDRFVNKHLDLLPAGRGLSDIRELASAPLTVLMAMVGLVLLIACANIANLLIARATGRQKEIAVRLALGAGRTQIVRQLLVESMLLAALGGSAGLLIASWASRTIAAVSAFRRSEQSDDNAGPSSVDVQLRDGSRGGFAVRIGAGATGGAAQPGGHIERSSRERCGRARTSALPETAGGRRKLRFPCCCWWALVCLLAACTT